MALELAFFCFFLFSRVDVGGGWVSWWGEAVRRRELLLCWKEVVG